MTSRPLQIGITGCIGSGKSMACKVFFYLGIPVYDADMHAKELMQKNKKLVEDIQKTMGRLVYHEGGKLNKTYLRRLFSNPDYVMKMNKLIHPYVAADYRRWVTQQRDCPYLIKEAALLVESGSIKQLDKLIVVQAPQSLRIRRICVRDPERTKKNIFDIMKNQMSEKEKINHADHVIINDEKHLMVPQIVALHQLFLSTFKRHNALC